METAGEDLSVHSPGHAPPSSASSLPKEYPQVDLELRILEALEIYRPTRLQGLRRMSSSVLSTFRGIKQRNVYCNCGRVSVKLTCRREDNYGRKFWC